jgi:tape measure domain-containing protein
MANNTVIHSIEFTGDASKLQAACTQAAQAVSNLGNSLNANSNNINTVSTSLSNLTSRVSGLFSGIGIALSAATFINFAKSAVQTSANLEQLTISFEVFTGSVEVANTMLAKLKDQALNSPMQFQDITKGAQILMQYGLTAEQVVPITKMLGDVSGGNADKFNRLALAFGQVNASGRLMGQEARQMINAGFNPLQAISEKTGESMASLAKRMHDGKISVQEVGNAFTYATSEGGRFFGMADKQSQTLQGQFNKLQESISFAMAELGTAISDNLQLADTIAYLSDQVNIFTESIKSLNEESGKTSPILSLINIIAKSVVVSIDSLKNAVIFLKDSFNLFIEENSGVILFFKNVLSGIEILAEKIPVLGKYVTQLSDYWTNFYNRGAKELPIAMQINNLKNDIIDLQKNPNMNLKFGLVNAEQVQSKILELQRNLSELVFKNTSKDLKLDNKPPGLDKEIKVKKSEAQKQYERDQEEMRKVHEKAQIENYKRQEKLIEIEKDTIFKLGSLNLSAEEKALADLKNEFENKKKIYEEGNRSIVNLETLYNEERDKLQKEYASKRRRQAIDDLQAETEGLKSEYPKRLSDFYNEFLNTDIQGKIGNYAQSVYSAIKDLNVNLATGVAELAGTALATGMSMADTFKAFGAIILNALGDVLIKIGTSAIAAGMVGSALKAFFSGGISTVPELGIAGGIAAVTIGSAMKALSGNIKNAQSNLGNKSTGVTTPTATRTSNMSSGSSYQYGGSSYSTQSMRLSIDLTGSITATQTGYQINKSLETVLRVTGR